MRLCLLSDLEVYGGIALLVDAELRTSLPGSTALSSMPTMAATARPERLTLPILTAPASL